MAGLYIHIPFCRSKCLYCDFYSLVGKRGADDKFVNSLKAEFFYRIKSYPFSAEGFKFDTLYIGGGTPSLLAEQSIASIIDFANPFCKPSAEITIEVNPEDVTQKKASLWREMGINRVSMGVQSLVNAELRKVGRRHSAEDAKRAYEILRPVFENISLDVIFGLPGQSLSSWEQTIEGILKMSPEHISAYSLMYEERAVITRLRDKGVIKETPEEDSEAMFKKMVNEFSKDGYRQYEISNFSRPGFESQHNSSYWKGDPYMGLGPGAHGYDGHRTRYANIADINRYLGYWGEGVGNVPCEIELLDDNDLREEMIMTRLRTREGLNLDEFEHRFGTREKTSLLKSAAPGLARKHLEIKAANLCLTQNGIMISDEIISDLF